MITLSVKSQNGLDCNVDTAESISIKHNLAHLLPVLKGVHGRLCQENLLALSIDLELLVEGVIPERLWLALLSKNVFHVHVMTSHM